MLIQCRTIVRPCSSSALSQSLSPAVEPGSSSDEVESVSGQESSQSGKRKRSNVETEPERDSDTDSKHQFSFYFLICLFPLFFSLLRI